MLKLLFATLSLFAVFAQTSENVAADTEVVFDDETIAVDTEVVKTDDSVADVSVTAVDETVAVDIEAVETDDSTADITEEDASEMIVTPVNTTGNTTGTSSGLLPEMNLLFIIIVAAIGAFLALVLVVVNTIILRKNEKANKSVEDEKVADDMIRIADLIQDGAKDFLKVEYKYLTGFVVVFAIILFVIFTVQETALNGLRYAGCFVAGATLSALAGWYGMIIATDANVRTTHAAAKGDANALNSALQVAFTGGSVMGFTVVGLGLFGVVVMFLFMTLNLDAENDFEMYKQAVTYLTGFGFGASSIALFARVAGGIYTKAADVGADLVGKVEEDLPEDDPRNPAVIADNVGDNVGDVAGMGADLFESYVGSIIAACSLASNAHQLAFPFWIAGFGVLCAAIGSKAVYTKANATQKELLSALKRGTYLAMALSIGCFALIVYILDLHWALFGCTVIGLIAGELIGHATEYATSYAFAPTMSISLAGKTGAATVVIQGLGVGMLSCLPPTVIMVVTILACNALEGIANISGGYGIAVAAVGMLSTLGVTLATDAYGPVADNAGGIAEMAGLPEGVREITDSLDALGNTTAATGKGFAIGSAVLTALSLLSSFKIEAGLANVTLDIADPIILGGILFGAVLPFVFAALTMLSVRKAATSIILEVRRQFRLMPHLKDPNSTDTPDYKECIRISTVSSLEEMILPGVLAILMPVTIGFLVGPRCLTGMLSGAISAGFMMGVMMSNAGGAWDNAKKYQEIECKAKGTDTHKATVVGDTVGDPFKDTSGPALNILIKLMSMVSLVIAPLLKANSEDWASYYWGFIPLALMFIVTIVVYCKFWKGFEDKVEAKHQEYDDMKGQEGEELIKVGTN